MPNSNYWPLIGAFFISLVSCSQTTNETVVHTFSTFNKEIDLDFESTGTEISGLPGTIYFDGTNVLISNIRSKKLLTILNKDFQFRGDFINRGKGPNELLSISWILPNPNSGKTILLGDLASRKIIEINLDSVLEFGLNGSNYKIRALEGNTGGITDPKIIYPGGIVSPNMMLNIGRLHLYTNQFTFLKPIGDLPSIPKSWPKAPNKDNPFDLAATAFDAAITTHPDKPWVALGNHMMDQIEIYKGDTLFKKLIGPDQFEFQMELIEMSPGNYTTGITDQTRFGYMDLWSTDDYFIAQYYGSTHPNCTSFFAIFDWHGNPIAQVNTLQNVCYCWVGQEQENLIFLGIDNSTSELLKGGIPLITLSI